jgi:hypothetical protein
MRAKPLNSRKIESHVPSGTVGFYRLGCKPDGEFAISYFGRSDTDLKRRLDEHVDSRNETHFTARVTDNIHTAFKLECREWHAPVETSNLRHPDAPDGIAYTCPYCHIADEIRSAPELARQTHRSEDLKHE